MILSDIIVKIKENIHQFLENALAWGVKAKNSLVAAKSPYRLRYTLCKQS